MYIQDGGCQTGNTFILAEEQLPVILRIPENMGIAVGISLLAHS